MSFINMVKRTRQNYNSPIAQTIEASSRFFNSIKNPWFVIALVAIIGGEYIFYNSLDKLTSKLDTLIQSIIQQNTQNAQQIEILKNTNYYLTSIQQELKDYHNFQKKKD